MSTLFYLAGAVALVSTAMVITRTNPVHALLYLVLSLLSVAVVFFTLGAPFVAALEVIVYAGAIMVLFLFVVMMLSTGGRASDPSLAWSPRAWAIPALLAVLLMAELAVVVSGGAGQATGTTGIDPKQVGMALYGPYLLGVELASVLLLAGLVGAYHLGRKKARAGVGGQR